VGKRIVEEMQTRAPCRAYRIGNIVYVPDYFIANVWRGPGNKKYDIDTLKNAGAIEVQYMLWPRHALIKEKL